MPRDVYACLGDSITVGQDASHRSLTYVGRVAQRLSTLPTPYKPVVLAQSGWTSRHLLQAVRALPPDWWSTISSLSVMIGGNDLRRRYYAAVTQPDAAAVLAPALNAFRYNLHAVCDIVSSHDVPQVLLHTVYNPLPNSPLCVYAFRQLNEIIESCAVQRGYDVIDVHAAFLGHEIDYIHHYRTGRLEDMVMPFQRPIHPNDHGHEAIAREVCQRIEARLSKPPRTRNKTVKPSAARRNNG